jgi:hypothetical protein
MEHMGMELSLITEFVDVAHASGPIGGRSSATSTIDLLAGSVGGAPAADPADDRESGDDTEFWDACWTLEDERVPRSVVRPVPASRPISGSLFALL